MRKSKKLRGLLLFLIAVVIFIYAMTPSILRWIYPLYFEEHIGRYSSRYDIDPPLLAAVIKTESNFDPFAESRKGARGLMQITPATGQWIAEKLKIKNYNDDMLFDPEININFGCWYISYLHERYNQEFHLIFAAYNGGQGNVDKWLKDSELSSDGKRLDKIPFSETENYVQKIKENHKMYKQIYKWDD